ncbi:MAG: enoyl-CoA hydratase/isomerase family protein [Bacillota bacterium]
MSFKFIKTSNNGGIIRITLNRPPVNVLTIAMIEELINALKWAQEEPGSLVVIGAEGKAFCAGVDIADHTPEKVESMIDVFDRLFMAMDEVEKPLVAAVNGVALGGGYEIVLYCDLVIVSEKAKLGQPEIAVGVFPPVACYLLPRLVSWPQAMELLLGGDAFDAVTGEKMGLVNKVLPVEGFEAGVEEYLKIFLNKSPKILALTKKAARTGLDKDMINGLKAIDHIYLKELMQTEDALEGLKAFMEKRPPNWRGK